MTSATTAAVPRSVFSLDDCPPGERFDFWRHSIAAIFDVDAVQEVVADFHASIDSHLVGPLMLARTRTLRQRWARAARTVARDGMDHYMIQLYEHGGQTVRIGGESREMRAGQLIVCDLQRTMDNDTTDFQNLSLLAPRALLAPRLEHPDDVHGLIVDGAAPVGGALRNHLVAAKKAAGSLGAADVQRAVEETLGVAAACLNGLGRAARGRPVEPPVPPLQRLKRYIRENLHDPTLTPESVATRQGLSAPELYEIFAPEGGLLVYLRVLRLKAAFDALRDPLQLRRSVAEVARQAGFDSETAFARTFERLFEVAPGEVRRAAERMARRVAPQPGIDRRYEDWLHRLDSPALAGFSGTNEHLRA